MNQPLRPIAFFDFDGTLVKGDSFFPFLGFLAGWHRLVGCFVVTLSLYMWQRITTPNVPAPTDHRTFIKKRLLNRLVAGRNLSELPAVLDKMHLWLRWNPLMKQALMEHHAKGHHIVVASGGLDLYLSSLLKDMPVDVVICTHIGVKDNMITGDMINGNCVRQRKAELVSDYMQKKGPFSESWGYGNLPHDLPMLELLKHRVVV
jgi:HAD superfamily hydrolase (TIGR01490 family)